MPEIPDIPEELPVVDEAATQEICGGTPTSQERDAGHRALPRGLKPGSFGGADGGTEVPPFQSEAAESAETVEIDAEEVETREETPVLDVHAPHVGIHTWKDFWIHLGTISVGLLIAIGLEQSVEKLHQLNERHELETALRMEAERNKDVAEVNFRGYDEEMTWLQGMHEDIGRMLATGGKANLPYRPPHFHAQFASGEKFISTGEIFATVVWDTAAEDNRLSLLPNEEARAYSSQYHYTDARYLELQIAIRDDLVRQDAFEAQFADIGTPTTPVMARMSPAELKQYDALVTQTFTAVRMAKGWLIALYGSNEALRQGQYDTTSEMNAMGEASVRYKNNYAKMAQGVAAEDAVRDKAAAVAAAKGK